MAWKLADEYSKERDPRLLPQHRAVRPRRLRHRGGRAGVLRQDGAQGRLPRAAADPVRGDGAGRDGQAARGRTRTTPRGSRATTRSATTRPARTRSSGGRYIRDGLVALKYLTAAEAADLAYPDTVRDYDPRAGQSGLDRPTGLRRQPRAERAAAAPIRSRTGRSTTSRNGGFRIVTTVDKRAQDAAEAAANIRGENAPEAVRGQPANWQAALVAVEPGTGRVLAYYGGNDGTGADYAGWYFDEEGNAGRLRAAPAGLVVQGVRPRRGAAAEASRRSSGSTPRPPRSSRRAAARATARPGRSATPAVPRASRSCTLWEATVASLNTTYFGLTEQLGVPAVIDMARKAGVDVDVGQRGGQARTGPGRPARQTPGADAAPRFSTEVGIGQYGITVQDHANGMATFAAGGKRAEAHFVRIGVQRGRRGLQGAADADRRRADRGADQRSSTGR